MRVEQSAKRIRGLVDGVTVFDTTRALMVWEVPHYPAYYVPAEDVLAALEPNGRTKDSRTRGRGELLDLRVGGVSRADAARRYPEAPETRIRETVRFEWEALDEWLEEDEPVYVHPRDPYKRVDILASSRHVEVVVDGVKVADSHRPTILFETSLPPRYYLPLTDVRTDLLIPSDTTTQCPYKGTAAYWSLRLPEREIPDAVWTYRTPLPESQKVAGLVAFYNERVDLYVDGELQRRPRTAFSDG